jgi:hypothetical protein
MKLLWAAPASFFSCAWDMQAVSAAIAGNDRTRALRRATSDFMSFLSKVGCLESE